MSATHAHRLLVVLAVASSVWVGCDDALPPSASSPAGEPAEPPHIFLITADTLRPDHLSSRGYARSTSPSLDAFASGAWDFRNAVTVIPKTGPSFATLFSGHHPEEHRVRSNFDGVPNRYQLLAEYLKRAGYRTAAFVGNPVLRPQKGYSRGFDVYKSFGKDGVAQVFSAFDAWSKGPWTRPTFVWVHFLDPHGPYRPPPSYESLFIDDALAQSDVRVPLEPDPALRAGPRKMLGAIPKHQIHGQEDRVALYVARYDAEIRYLDFFFEQTIRRIRSLGLYDDSVIVFASDHGESLGEHDFYFEHGWFAYDASLRIPLLIKEPGQRSGTVVPQQVSTLDLLPTLLGVAGLSPPPALAGRNLLEPLAPDAPVLVQNSDRYPHKFHGARDGSWKYLVREEGAVEELYDLASDPGETRNVADRHPKRVRRLRQWVEAELDALRGRGVSEADPGRADDEETSRRLEALGYVE